MRIKARLLMRTLLCGCLASPLLATTVHANDGCQSVGCQAGACDCGCGLGFESCDSTLFPDTSLSPESSYAPSAPSMDLASPSSSAPSLAFSQQSAALGGSSFPGVMPSIGGYIDDAIIRSRVRVRYDYLKNASFPDRAEYYYSLNQNLGGRGPSDFGGLGIGNLDFQEIRTYVEWAMSPAFSLFGEFPVRFVNADTAVDGGGNAFINPISGQASDTVAGAGDISAGLRFALIARPDQYLTTQIRATAPSGNPQLGLGTGHSTVEVGLLFQQRCRDRWTVFGEVQDWIAINASRIDTGQATNPNAALDGQLFGGNVLRYGLGLGYDVWTSGNRCKPSSVTAVFEVVGWSVLDGFKSNVQQEILDAQGDTIINGKYGLRFNHRRNTVYLGYGTAWTNEQWYSDILRLELGHYF